MGKRIFVKDSRFDSSSFKGKHIKRIFLTIILSIFCIIVFAAIFCFAWNFSLTNKMDKTYDEFIRLCDEQNYYAAMDVYRNLKKDALDAKHITFKQNLMDEQIEKIEEDIKQRVIQIAENLKIDSTKLNNNQVNMLKAFSELTSREMKAYYFEYLSDLILGNVTPEEAKLVTDEFMKVDAIKGYLADYSTQLDHIHLFSKNIPKLNKAIDNEEYFDVLKKLDYFLKEEKGFVNEYLTKLKAKVKEKAYPKFILDINSLIERKKYYSALGYLEKVNLYFEQDEEILNKIKSIKEYTFVQLVDYTEAVEHLAIRPLISTPNFNFEKDELTKTAEDLMLTANEFKIILEELYKNNYVLIDINSLEDEENKFGKIRIPIGKKPIIISIEGLNYYASRRLTGNSINLSIDKNNKVVSEYFDKNNNLISDRNGEAIGILETFVEKNADFSFDGAKGNISLTGFECIFGFVTDIDQVDDRTANFKAYGLGAFNIDDTQMQKNKENAKKIIDILKQNGWSFSSSTYGSISVGESTIEQLKGDTKKWFEQVGILTGDIKTILFPNGSVVSSKDNRGDYLIKSGFTIHCGIGPWAYHNYSDRNMFMDRVALNGQSMRTVDLSRFFDVTNVYDSSRTKKLK